MTRHRIRKRVTLQGGGPNNRMDSDEQPMSTTMMLRAIEESPPETWFSVALRNSVMIVGRVDDYPPGTGHKYIMHSIRSDDHKPVVAGEPWDVMTHGTSDRDMMLLHLSPVVALGDPGWLAKPAKGMGDYLMGLLRDGKALAGIMQLYPDGEMFECLMSAKKVAVLGPQEPLYGR